MTKVKFRNISYFCANNKKKPANLPDAGDSGGPAVFEGNLVGITSNIVLNPEGNGVDQICFVKISYFFDFINYFINNTLIL